MRIKGNHLVDAGGNLVVLRGVSHSGSEYTCLHSSGIFEGKIDESFVAGLKSWKNLNAVRLPMNEDCCELPSPDLTRPSTLRLLRCNHGLMPR